MRLLLYLIIWFPGFFIFLIVSSLVLFSVSYRNNSKPDSLSNYFLFPKQNTENRLIITPDIDYRLNALRNFFTKYNSPLVSEVDNLISIADSWGIDYRLIPAIAMQESGGCKIIPPDSYNCWGFGVYGAKTVRFTSYKQAIEQVAKVIKQTYIKQGYTNPTLLEDKWTPSSRGSWSYGVNFFIGKIKDEEAKLIHP